MNELIEIVPCRDLVATMGEVGQAVYDSQRGIIAYIGLTNEARAICRNYLPPASINGAGD